MLKIKQMNSLGQAIQQLIDLQLAGHLKEIQQLIDHLLKEIQQLIDHLFSFTHQLFSFQLVMLCFQLAIHLLMFCFQLAIHHQLFSFQLANQCTVFQDIWTGVSMYKDPQLLLQQLILMLDNCLVLILMLDNCLDIQLAIQFSFGTTMSRCQPTYLLWTKLFVMLVRPISLLILAC